MILQITCKVCLRKFHRTEACVGPECMSLQSIICSLCSMKSKVLVLTFTLYLPMMFNSVSRQYLLQAE